MSTYYSSRYRSGGVSYFRSTYSPSSYSFSGLGDSDRPLSSYYRSSWNSRPRNLPGSHRLDFNELYFKYRQYAPKDNDVANEGKKVLDVDLKIKENRQAHRTDKYGVKGLVIRRGQQFTIDLETKVPFDQKYDSIQFLFFKGKKPQETKRTLVRVPVYEDKASAESHAHPDDWLAYISSVNGANIGAKITIVIIPSVTSLVGKYTLKTKLFGKALSGSDKRFIKEEEGSIYLLFNAWIKDDQVYMEKEDHREEYVLRETGRIWVGSVKNYGSRPWNFGQFSKHCLEAACYLLDKSYLNDTGHGNATLVARALSAMVNVNDNDGGVLVGNWSGHYEGGTGPSAWNGSQAILEEYMMTKRAVRFGQCWVFSGVLTTVGRTLGIPTRTVTNFASAHDTDFSMTIDRHFDYAGNNLSAMDDSVWNFHVWNESWFRRPDLPDGYDGWQAYDATPQEESEGMMRCGPASCKAIKEGNVYLGYDAKFVFGEVNGDRVTWLVADNGDMVPIKAASNINAVGKLISTKAVGTNFRDDITDHYKYNEGTPEERKSVQRASRFSSRKDDLDRMYTNIKEDVEFDYQKHGTSNGDIAITITAKNNSSEERNFLLRISSHSTYYTGVTADDLSNQSWDLTLQPGENIERDWSLQAKDYLNIISEDAKVKLFVMARVRETNQVFADDEIFEIEKPDLDIKVSNKKPHVGEKIEVTISMTNPVDVALTQGVIRIEGPGIQKNLKIPLHRTVNPGESFTEKLTLTPKFSGSREIIACFNSRQLVAVNGAVEIETIQ